MQYDWLGRWQENRIGFHQENVNSRMIRYWHRLALNPAASVFVPLCGKTQDMIWLKEAGYSVIGNELSDIACRDFFNENALALSESKRGKFNRFANQQVELLQGDFFDLVRENLEDVTGVFDRASLVALPANLRTQYADHMATILTPGCKMLLITMEYDQSKMQGPPFSVTEEEVRELFSSSFTIETISESSGPEILGNLKDRGLETLTEKVYLIERTHKTI